MYTDKENEKNQQFLEKVKQFVKGLGLGLFEGGVIAGMVLLLILGNVYAVFGVILIWLVFGWCSSYLIRNVPFEIIVVLLSTALSSGVILYFGGITLWFISMITGLGVISWAISYTTKTLLYPAKESSVKEKELSKPAGSSQKLSPTKKQEGKEPK